jgi:hypothetical protein
MKIDLVVNTMIQQIDKNLQSQVIPALTFRAGEILHGRVMLTSDDKMQIRLDNGALLNAVPSGNVLLSAGATVTLRVSGQMDGQFVMQLLEQELSSELTGSVTTTRAANEALSKLGLSSSPQGRQVLQAFERMNLPIREETVRQALDILGTFPGLAPEKAVFMAANRIPATQANVNALIGLIDGKATTGDDLIKLTNILTAQAVETDNVQSLGSTLNAAVPTLVGQAAAENAVPQQGNGSSTMGMGNLQNAEELPQGSANPLAKQPAGADTATAAQGPGGDSSLLSDLVVPAFAGGGQAPGATTDTGAIPVGNAQQASAATLNGDDGILQMQSLVFVALGVEDADRYSAVIAHMADSGVLKQALQLALDGPFLGGKELQSQLGQLVAAMPAGSAPEAQAFMEKLVTGLGKYIADNGGAALASHQALEAPSGLPRVIQEITGLFAKLDGNASDMGANIAKAAGAQQASLAHIAAEIGSAAAASPDVTMQLNKIASHVRLIDNISQYAYQQIPVQINDRNRTVELYVLNRGKNGKKINPNNANILIALDTDNMGHLETLINVTNKNLRLRFGVENPELVGFIDSFTTELSQAMQDIGYRLSDVRMQVTDKPVTPLTVTEVVEPKTGSLTRLDMKL